MGDAPQCVLSRRRLSDSVAATPVPLGGGIACTWQVSSLHRVGSAKRRFLVTPGRNAEEQVSYLRHSHLARTT